MNTTSTGPRTKGGPASNTGAQRQPVTRLSGPPARSATGPPPLPRPQAARPAPSAVFGHALRAVKVALYTFIPITMLAAMAAGVMFVRLRHGPIGFDILVPPIERGINAELVNNSVKIKGAELRLGENGALEFRLRDVSVHEKDGDVVATAPLAAVNLSTAALWRGRIVPARIELIDPFINLLFTEEGGLALSATRPEATENVEEGKAAGQAPGAEPSPAEARQAAKGAPRAQPARQINLARMLSEASNRARQRLDATSYLAEFGLRNATVALEYAGQKSAWKVPIVEVDFNHGSRRSVISGRATVASEKGPWALSFLTDESEQNDKLLVKTTIRDLVPSTLAAAAPPLALLRMFDMAVSGDATVELTTAGDFDKTEIALEVGSGQIVIPNVTTAPFNLTGGLFRLSYDGKERLWRLAPSPVKWGDGNVLLSGTVRDVADAKGPPTWHYAFEGKNASIDGSEFNVPPVTLDVLTASGNIIPRHGIVDVADFAMKGGGGEIAIKGSTQAGPNGQSSRADVTISPMPLATLKALWPRAVAPDARTWVGARVTSADFKGGNVTFASGDFLKGEAPEVSAKGERLSATFEFDDGTAIPMDGMTPITAPRTLVRLENNALEIAIPDAAAILPGNRRVPIKAMRLASPDIVPLRPDGEVEFSVTSPLGPLLEVLETLPIKAVRDASPLPKAGEGKVDAQIKLKLPLTAAIDTSDISFEGKAKITDGRFGKVAGQYDVQGFTLFLDATDKTIDAKGDLLVNGVPAKITGQRIFGADADKQPPFKITANLDDADRTQLGLDINDLVHGTTPIEISCQKGLRPEPAIKLKADLTTAELAIDQLSWRKAAGRTATLETDIVSGKTNKVELQNFKVSGDDIAIEGWVGVGADNKIREFYFPEFSLNVVSQLEVQGARSNDDIWAIKARGTTFDGRDLFRSLFAVGESNERKIKAAKPAAGVDLVAEVDNVLGGGDVSLKNLKLKLSSRGEKLAALDARGTLNGGAPLAAVLENKGGGPRRLLADSTDAGQTLRLVGFYPNMQGGRLRLEVNLDGRGAAEKTGILWTEDFKVLGDPIVSEVVSSADQARKANGGRQVTREVFEFDRLRAPFSVGYGQFVLDDSYLKGPLVGANLRGKVDFKTRRVNLGGTYIPLQGLNGALGGIPLLGQIISGTNGEGIFGITFAVQGAMSNPQVIVNPLSMVAPGIFREMFQMTNPDSEVQVREDRAPTKPVEQRVRASSTPADGEARPARAPKGGAGGQGVVDGWSSTTTPSRKN